MPSLTDSFATTWAPFGNVITRSRAKHANVGRNDPMNVHLSGARNARLKSGVRLFQKAGNPAQKKFALEMILQNWPD